MSDEAIPDDIWKAAEDAYAMIFGDPALDISAIARAIQAERERCNKRWHQAMIDRDKVTTSPSSCGN